MQLAGLVCISISVVYHGVLALDVAIALFLVGIVLGSGGFVWVCIGVRCPRCGARIFWHAALRESLEGSFFGLLSHRACPVCGYVPNADDPSVT